MTAIKRRYDGFKYNEAGVPHYHQLYPLMDSYWDASLSDMPDELRLTVMHAVPSWDQIFDSENEVGRLSKVMIRRIRVISYDIKFDLSQEQWTRIGLREYLDIDEGRLNMRIDDAFADVQHSVATILHEHVELPLREIYCKFAVHWPDPYPSLWRELYKFRKMNLIWLTEYAKRGGSCYLIDVMKELDLDIYKLLERDGCNIDYKTIEAEFEINTAAITSPAFNSAMKNFECNQRIDSLRLKPVLLDDVQLVANIVARMEVNQVTQERKMLLVSSSNHEALIASHKTVHKLKGRNHILTAEINCAKQRAIDKENLQSVWDELVKLAEAKYGCLQKVIDVNEILYGPTSELQSFKKKSLGGRLRNERMAR